MDDSTNILHTLQAVADKYSGMPPRPVAAVMLPSFYEIVKDKSERVEVDEPNPHSIFMSKKRIGFGIRVYQRNTITLPGERTYFAPTECSTVKLS